MNHPVVFAVVTGLGIGALGSFHCVGMCGPIALALPVKGKSAIQKVWAIWMYNLGRASSYALMGFIFGWLGSTFSLFGWQQWLSVMAGIFILLLLSFNYILPGMASPLGKWNLWVKKQLSRILQSEKKPVTYLSLGFLNGWLPCGLVYVAMASSLATGTPWGGALLMFSFGLGTIPVMAGLMAFGRLLSLKVRAGINKAVPYLLAGMAVLLILRGLNLGIPYLSPSYNAEEHCVENCCKPK